MSADQETPFDPNAPFIDAWGVKYANVAARLKGQPLRCPENTRVESLRRIGRSQAYCRAFAEAYEAEGGEPLQVYGEGAGVDRLQEVARRVAAAVKRTVAALGPDRRA